MKLEVAKNRELRNNLNWPDMVICPDREDWVSTLTCIYNECGQYGGFDGNQLICLSDKSGKSEESPI